MKIFITGGTGLIGSALIKVLLERGCELTLYTRNVENAKEIFGNKVSYQSSLDVNNLLDGYDAVINLAGASIAGGRWSSKRKELLCNSRWMMTRKISDLIKNSKNPPSVFISGSAIGYYGDQKDQIVTEQTRPHEEFTYSLCRVWEKIAMQVNSEKTRVCLLRTGIVLSSAGGMLPKLSLPFKLGLGSVMGSGKQYISWIHISDMVNGIVFLLDTPHALGAFNMVAPMPVTNSFFSKTLAAILHRPCWFRIPSFPISLIMGEAATLILDGQRALPEKLESVGYKFRYQDLKQALDSIYIK